MRNLVLAHHNKMVVLRVNIDIDGLSPTDHLWDTTETTNDPSPSTKRSALPPKAPVIPPEGVKRSKEKLYRDKFNSFVEQVLEQESYGHRSGNEGSMPGITEDARDIILSFFTIIR